jgi:hypothetical protein
MMTFIGFVNPNEDNCLLLHDVATFRRRMKITIPEAPMQIAPSAIPARVMPRRDPKPILFNNPAGSASERFIEYMRENNKRELVGRAKS